MPKYSIKNVDRVVYRKTCVAINRQACQIVRDLKSKEAELIRILQEVDKWGVHRFCGYNSLYQYALNMLELTESQACDYIRVARRAVEIPELQKDIDTGELSVSKARRIIPVADAGSYREWSHKAKTCSKRELEQAIARKNPKLNVPEHCRIVAPDVYHMQAPINEQVFKKLQRTQAVINQKQQSWVKVNELLNQVLDVYLDKHDPLRKAERAQARVLKAGRHGKTPEKICMSQAAGGVDCDTNALSPGPGQVTTNGNENRNINAPSPGPGQVTANGNTNHYINAPSPGPGQVTTNENANRNINTPSPGTGRVTTNGNANRNINASSPGPGRVTTNGNTNHYINAPSPGPGQVTTNGNANRNINASSPGPGQVTTNGNASRNINTPSPGPVTTNGNPNRNINASSPGPGRVTTNGTANRNINTPTPGSGRVKSQARMRVRSKVPAAVKHEVFVRDKFQCQWVRPDGSVCGEKQFIELHHRRPVSQGGQHWVENLVVFCSGHHQAWHDVFSSGQNGPNR